MITHLPRSPQDIKVLNEINYLDNPQAIQTMDYRKKIVDKPWGYEYLMFQNEFVAIWILFLKEGYATSMHCHPIKMTSLTVLSGQVETSSLNSKTVLNELDGIIIDKATFHSTQAISSEGAFIMEIETPPNKTDLVRYKDSNGRTTSQYENAKDNGTHAEYEHVFFDESKELNTHIKKGFLNKTISVLSHDNFEALSNQLNHKKIGIICPLTIIDTKHLELGRIIHTHELPKTIFEEKNSLQSHIETLIIY